MRIIDIKLDPSNNVVTDMEFRQTLDEAFSEDRTALFLSEMGNLFRLTKKILRLEGDIAEVGVYRGGSAKIIAQACGHSKKIHLFDTFAGIAETTQGLDDVQTGDFAVSLEDVQAHLSAFKNIQYHQGMFPDSALQNPEICEKKFALVNLDVDTYLTTLKALDFFYPRMNRGGLMIIHDYNSQHCKGVKKAVDEFFVDKPETLIELWATQVVAAKL